MLKGLKEIDRNDCIGSLSPQRWDGSWCECSPGRGDGCVGAVGMGTTEARSQTMSSLEVGARVSCGGGTGDEAQYGGRPHLPQPGGVMSTICV